MKLLRNTTSHQNTLLDEQLATNAQVLQAVKGLLLVTTILIALGLTMLYSASYGTAGLKYFRNQLIWVSIGVSGALSVFFIGYQTLAKMVKLWLVIIFAALILCLCFDEINGARRWIQFGSFSIQPSEFAKIILALFTAKYCSDFPRSCFKLKSRRGLIYPYGCTVALVIIAIILGEDMGTTALICAMLGLTLLVGGLPLRWMFAGITLMGGGAAVYVAFFDSMRLARSTSFINPESVMSGKGYQLWNSLMALGSGGWFGIGFMKSRMKAKYLPEAHTDFVVSVMGEELGYAIILFVLALYVLFGYYCIKISLNARSRLGMLLTIALMFGILLQAAINLLVVSGSAPTKGMPAPFLSYGGSNMIACLVAVGFIISVALDTLMPDYQQQLQQRLKFRKNS